LVRFLVSFETMDTARHTQSAQCLAPGNGFGSIARHGGERMRHFGAPANDAINLFLDIDGRLFHGIPG